MSTSLIEWLSNEVPTFEEGNHRYQTFVSWRALPLGDDDRVFGMGHAMVRVCIEKNDFG